MDMAAQRFVLMEGNMQSRPTAAEDERAPEQKAARLEHRTSTCKTELTDHADRSRHTCRHGRSSASGHQSGPTPRRHRRPRRDRHRQRDPDGWATEPAEGMAGTDAGSAWSATATAARTADVPSQFPYDYRMPSMRRRGHGA